MAMMIETAQCKATRRLVEDVGNMLMADEGCIKDINGRLVWRFGVFITGRGHAPHQLAILRQIGVPVAPAKDVETATAVLIIDGLIGYSLQGSPHGAAAHLIGWTNRQDAPVLALDAPSGLDSSSGTIYDPAIRATATMTLALPKVGLLGETAVAHVGELYLADISLPPALYASPALQLEVGPIFATSDIVRI